MSKRKTPPESPDTSDPPKKSKTDGISAFPNFDDGDVFISLGYIKMKLHKQTLCSKSTWFASHKSMCSFPENFTLSTKDTVCTVEPTDPVVEEEQTAETELSWSSRNANEVVFRLLYDRPVQLPSGCFIKHVVELAEYYGCIPALKDQIVTAILSLGLQKQALFSEDPWSIMIAASRLQDKDVYSEAILHVAGQRDGPRDPEKWESLPPTVAEQVHKYADRISEHIRSQWTIAQRAIRANTRSMPSIIASSLIRNRVFVNQGVQFLTRLFYDLVKTFYNLHKVDDILEHRVGRMTENLDHGIQASRALLDDIPGHEQYLFEEESHKIDMAAGEGVNMRTVTKALTGMLDSMHEALDPLFQGDKHTGYFTFMRFEGPFPWENAVS